MIKNNTNWNQDYYNDEELEKLYVDGTFEIDLNGFVNVDGNVNLNNKELTVIPFKFGKITGNFWCGGNRLTSLKGCPYYVGGNFSCSYNNLESLEYAPKYVGDNFYCYDNKRKFSKIEIMKCIKVIGDVRN